jgi:hypothetical protein
VKANSLGVSANASSPSCAGSSPSSTGCVGSVIHTVGKPCISDAKGWKPLGFSCSDTQPLFYFCSVAFWAALTRALDSSVSTMVLFFFLLGLSFWHMWILFYIKWKDFFLVSDDGFKMKQGICFWCGSDPGLCWDSCILVTCTFFFFFLVFQGEYYK